MQTLVNFIIGIFKNLADNIIASGGLPESFRFAIVAEIIDDRPRIEYVGITEAITVVPFADLGVPITRAVILCHLPHFFRRKAEVVAVFFIENGVDFQIVQTAENTLLRYTENACQKPVPWCL